MDALGYLIFLVAFAAVAGIFEGLYVRTRRRRRNDWTDEGNRRVW